MRQGTATAKVKTARSSTQMKAQVKPAKTRSKLLTKSELAGNENDAATDFVVGALLYSLFASNRCEIIGGLISNMLSDGDDE